MKRMTALLLSVLMILVLIPAVPKQHAAALDLSEEGVRAAMLALKAQYPDGTPFNSNTYRSFQGGIFSGGLGCAGFAFMLSDAAFGNLPARYYYDYSKIRVGDIIRMNNNGHSVVVLYVNENSITVAEGNMNGRVLWGREIAMSEVRSSSTTYAMTRYPETAKGDITGDASVSAEDAQLVLQAYVKTLSHRPSGLTQTQITGADVDGNGTVDLKDAQYILRYYVLNGLTGKSVPWSQIIK